MTDVPGLAFAPAPEAPDTFNVLLYGPPKAGKTTGAATLPGPILWVNCEGPGALAYARKVAAERDTEIREVRIVHGEDPQPKMRAVIEYLRSDQGADIQSVVVDTIGKLRDGLVGVIVDKGSKNSLRQYGQVGDKLEAFVRLLRDLPVNTCLLAHESIEDADGDRIVRPLVGGAMTEKVQGEVDVLAYVVSRQSDDGVEYLGVLTDWNGRRAGDRSGGLGASRALDLSEWLEAYRAALTPDDSDLPFDAEPSAEDEPAVEPEQQELAA